jgi:molybdopterin-synthase adenylyltransferase
MLDGRVRVLDMRRPRMNRQHACYVTVEGKVRIDAEVHGLGVEIEDPHGRVWAILTAMDGTRSPDEVIAETTAAHSTLSDGAATNVMQQLLEAGLLEDGSATPPQRLSERERTRYSRGVDFLQWIDRTPRSNPWDLQLRLRESRVLLIGVGGTGSTVAQGLVASGVGHLHCVDDDVVELSNLNRQLLYCESDLGAVKVEAAVDRLRALNSDVTVTGERRLVQGPRDIAGLLEPGYDVLLLCADQPPDRIRRWARTCLKGR